MPRSNGAGVSRAGMHLLTVCAQFAREDLVHNLAQRMNSHVIRRRFVFNSLKEGGGAQGRRLAEAFFRGVASPIKVIKILSVANRFTCTSSATCSYDPSPISLPFFFPW
jgi:hypothetical protein